MRETERARHIERERDVALGRGLNVLKISERWGTKEREAHRQAEGETR